MSDERPTKLWRLYAGDESGWAAARCASPAASVWGEIGSDELGGSGR